MSIDADKQMEKQTIDFLTNWKPDGSHLHKRPRHKLKGLNMMK